MYIITMNMHYFGKYFGITICVNSCFGALKYYVKCDVSNAITKDQCTRRRRIQLATGSMKYKKHNYFIIYRL